MASVLTWAAFAAYTVFAGWVLFGGGHRRQWVRDLPHFLNVLEGKYRQGDDQRYPTSGFGICMIVALLWVLLLILLVFLQFSGNRR